MADIIVKEFTYTSKVLKYQDGTVNGYLIKTFADGLLVKEEEFGTSVFLVNGAEADALSFTKFNTENFGVISSYNGNFYKLSSEPAPTPLISTPPTSTTPSTTTTTPPQSTYDERPIATGSYRTIKNIKWKMEVYKTPSNKLVFISNVDGERFNPPYSFPLNKTDLEVLDETLAKLNEQYKKPKEDPNKPEAILISGLDSTYNSGYKSLDEQLILFKYGFGDSKNIKIFRWSVLPSEVLSYLKQYPKTPIFMFSKGCELVGPLSKDLNADLNKMYVLEPYGASDKVINTINSAIKNGFPENHIFYGSSKATGKGIWSKSTSSGTVVKEVIIDGKKYSVGGHWSALINVPKLVK
jgi:hypothetical protein